MRSDILRLICNLLLVRDFVCFSICFRIIASNSSSWYIFPFVLHFRSLSYPFSFCSSSSSSSFCSLIHFQIFNFIFFSLLFLLVSPFPLFFLLPLLLFLFHSRQNYIYLRILRLPFLRYNSLTSPYFLLVINFSSPSFTLSITFICMYSFPFYLYSFSFSYIILFFFVYSLIRF